MVLDTRRSELFCCSCHDYQYDGNFDHILLVSPVSFITLLPSIWPSVVAFRSGIYLKGLIQNRAGSAIHWYPAVML